MTNRTALVTGASSGIGEAVAQSLAAAGYTVVACARREDRLDAVVSGINTSGGRAEAVACDLSRPDAAADVVAGVVDRHGRLDVLVNNAGVMLNGYLDGMSIEHLEAMLMINVHSLIWTSKAALRPMRAQGGGHIVNIASVAARNCVAAVATYSASKAAVVAFSEAIRKELTPDKIRVTVVNPGIVVSELAGHIPDPKVREMYAQFTASFDPLHASDVAEAVLFAVSRPARVGINEITIRPAGQIT